MSRAHMLYNDTAINKIINIKWKEKWQEEVVFRLKQGLGTTIEGKVKDKFRVTVSDPTTSGKVIQHYSVLDLEVTRAYKRQFDGNGQEIEPWKSATKKVNTGYLMSSYKTVDLETSAITLKDLLVVLNLPEFDGHLPKVDPNVARVFCNESNLANLEVNVGDCIRVKTKGKGPYVEYVARIDAGHVSASEHVDSSQALWTDKIMSMKGQDEKTSDQPEGVDEDEWDD